MKGMMVKRKIRKGNMARKKLKEIAEALEVMYPSVIPFIKNLVTSYKGIPSNPGRMIFLDNLMKNKTGFNWSILSSICLVIDHWDLLNNGFQAHIKTSEIMS